MRTIESYMDTLFHNRYFQGSVLVGHKGKILFKKGYGYASIEHAVPNTTETKFRIGSITKAFTAMLMLKQVEKGSIQLTDTLDCFFPTYKKGKQIHLSDLLYQRSGIPNFTSKPEYWSTMMRMPHTLNNLVNEIIKMPVTAQGEFEYSNSNYLLLTAILEKITKTSYEELLQKEILHPLALTGTGVDNGRKIVNGLASGYTVWEKYIHPEFIDMSIPRGAYGMYSTVEDLYKWSQALINQEMLVNDLHSNMFSHPPYGCGWFLEENGNEAWHFGDVNGFVNYFHLNFLKQTTVILLSNVNVTEVERIAKKLLQMVHTGEVEIGTILPTQPPSVYDPTILGVYENNQEQIIIDATDQPYVTISKMYGVQYRLPLVQLERNKWKSLYIEDLFEFNDTGNIVHTAGSGLSREYYRVEKGETNLEIQI